MHASTGPVPDRLSGTGRLKFGEPDFITGILGRRGGNNPLRDDPFLGIRRQEAGHLSYFGIGLITAGAHLIILNLGTRRLSGVFSILFFQISHSSLVALKRDRLFLLKWANTLSEAGPKRAPIVLSCLCRQVGIEWIVPHITLISERTLNEVPRERSMLTPASRTRRWFSFSPRLADIHLQITDSTKGRKRKTHKFSASKD
jgi:hypothetical protein